MLGRLGWIATVVLATTSGVALGQQPAGADRDQVAPEAPAQPGSIAGVVVTAGSGAPVVGATVTVDGDAAAAITGDDGRYRFTDIAPGQHTLTVYPPASEPVTSVITVQPGQVMSMTLEVGELMGAAETIIVTGTRSPEKRLDAPITVEVVGESELKNAAGGSYLSALAGVKGIDYSNAGINDQRISTRGFNTQFNSRMLSMVDGRLAQLPGSGLPQNNLLPNSSLDMKAVEVVVGPASAVYGANAHSGVVNVLTKSPWDQSGLSVALRGGTRSMTDAAIRAAGTFGSGFGWKVNGQYLRADDFEPLRSEPSHFYGTQVFEGDLVDGYDVESAKADGTLYYRGRGWQAKVGAGVSQNTGFSMTNAGRNHLRDWLVQYQVAQVSGGNWYAQVTRTATDAGKSYQLNRLAGMVDAMGGPPADPAQLDAIRDDIAFVDSSQLVDSELQYRNSVFGIETTAGLQARRYMPDSGGTYLADAVEDISATEIGGYLQLDRKLLSDRLRLVGAARVDRHSNYDAQFSPKASVQVRVADNHNLRAGYNRAFKSPTILENNLLINGILRGNRTGYEVRDGAGNVVSTIDPLRPERVNSVEVGYKGVFGGRLFVDAVAYDSWYDGFISPLSQVANPAADMPTFAFLPDGTVVDEGGASEGALFTYVNFGKAEVRGIDVGATYSPLDTVSISGGGSVIDLVSFENDSGLSDLLLNVPRYKLKAALAVDGLGFDGAFARLSGRYHSSYAFESGYWSASSLLGGRVPSRVVADVAAGWRFPDLGLTLSATVANLLDNRTPDVLGAPTPRRFGYLQLSYDYEGFGAE